MYQYSFLIREQAMGRNMTRTEYTEEQVMQEIIWSRDQKISNWVDQRKWLGVNEYSIIVIYLKIFEVLIENFIRLPIMLKHMAIALASQYESPNSTEAELIRTNYSRFCITIFEPAKDSCLEYWMMAVRTVQYRKSLLKI